MYTYHEIRNSIILLSIICNCTDPFPIRWLFYAPNSKISHSFKTHLLYYTLQSQGSFTILKHIYVLWAPNSRISHNFKTYLYD